MTTKTSSRDLLLQAASTLIRQKGYDGVGLNEILEKAGLPKGSLYHHFPGGKCELAEAATLWSGRLVGEMVDRVFSKAEDYTAGAAAVCQAIADLIGGQKILACPVASILQAGIGEPRLRDVGRRILSDWTSTIAGHARRLGHPEPEAAARLLIMQLEGAWLLALAEQDSEPLATLAQQISGLEHAPHMHSPDQAGE